MSVVSRLPKWLQFFLGYRFRLVPPGSTVATLATIASIEQIKFLLESAPMINMEPDYFRRAGTNFAFINPKTLAKYDSEKLISRRSPTRWVSASSMPEGRVLFSQVPLPGSEKGLVK